MLSSSKWNLNNTKQLCVSFTSAADLLVIVIFFYLSVAYSFAISPHPDPYQDAYPLEFNTDIFTLFLRCSTMEMLDVTSLTPLTHKPISN